MFFYRYFFLLLFLVVIFNILWFWAKFILKRNGYKTSWLSANIKDIPNMFRLAKKTEDPKKRKKYYYIAFGLTITLLIFPLVFIYFIFL